MLQPSSASLTPKQQQRIRPLRLVADNALLIHEIFASIQGESTFAGRPCTFVRTTACHLRCGYCDTRHAFAKGTQMDLDTVFDTVARLGLPLVEVTGGEPLLQKNVLPLMQRLCDAGHTVLLETSGSLDIGAVDPRVHRIVDLKTPSSGEEAHNLHSNLALLTQRDEVKFVLGSHADYLWAKQMMQQHSLAQRAQVLMGTVFGELPLADLSAWMVADRLPARLGVQLHKVIWDPERTGV
jgi:7-carboxy-7-deazaguanine synthase